MLFAQPTAIWNAVGCVKGFKAFATLENEIHVMFVF
jgi:hypothetical protein